MRNIALILLGLLLFPAPAAAEKKRPLILVLADDRSATEEVSADSFVLALLVHLKPENVDIRLSKWAAPPSLEDQEGLAGHRCSKSRAAAVTWYSFSGKGEEVQVTVHVVSFSHGAFQRQSMPMGRPLPGIERSMALSVQTLVTAHLARLRVPPSRPQEPESELPPSEPPAKGPAEPDRLTRRVELGARYDLDIFPLGDEVRHGPTATVHLRIVQDLHLNFGVGYRTTEDGKSRISEWSRDFLCLDLAMANWWRLNDRLEILGGGHVRGTVVFTRADRPLLETRDEATLWELSLGLTGGVKVRIWTRISGLLNIRLAWLPVGHQVAVGSLEVADPGAFEASMSLGLLLGLL